MTKKRHGMVFKRLISFFLLFLFAFSLSFAGCAHHSKNQPGIQNSANDSVTHEEEMGRQIHQAILSSFHVYTEPRVVGYVTRVGRSLAKKADRQDLVYRFTVLYDDRLYATSAPGGFVYITTGFINFLQNESELAAVLAHEIATVQFHDPRLSRARKAAGLLAQGGIIAAPFLGPIGSLAAGGIVLLSALSERNASSEVRIKKADRKALHYMIEACEDPQGYVDVLGRLLNPPPGWSPYLYDYTSSHPATLDRFQDVMKAFDKLPLQGRNFDVHRGRYLELTKGIREIYQR